MVLGDSGFQSLPALIFWELLEKGYRVWCLGFRVLGFSGTYRVQLIRYLLHRLSVSL